MATKYSGAITAAQTRVVELPRQTGRDQFVQAQKVQAATIMAAALVDTEAQVEFAWCGPSR